MREVARLLDTGLPTKFRWSSACRHGVRSALCLKGEKWARADNLAASIVQLALHRIGASRLPTWREGQPERATREYHFCSACGGGLDEASSSPWCGEICRNRLRLRERREAGRRDDAARARAVALTFAPNIAGPIWHKVERRCRHCSESYFPTIKHQRYCSRVCGARAVKYKARDCLICAEAFRPTVEHQVNCSDRCSEEAERRRRREQYASNAKVHSLTCRVCGSVFTSTRSYRAFCGERCSAEHERQRRLEKSRRARERAREGVTAEAA